MCCRYVCCGRAGSRPGAARVPIPCARAVFTLSRFRIFIILMRSHVPRHRGRVLKPVELFEMTIENTIILTFIYLNIHLLNFLFDTKKHYN